MERKIKLRSLNSHIICKICGGYLIDATTVTECLHTCITCYRFIQTNVLIPNHPYSIAVCKSCLVKHLEENNTCPSCNIMIHQSHPLQYISFDRTMQDIVYKLVPDLQDNETKREKDFYFNRGIICPKDMLSNNEHVGSNKVTEDDVNDADLHRLDEQVSICLECGAQQLSQLQRRFLRCSSQATVTHLKKFIALKLLDSIDAYRDVDILCNDELLGKDHTLKFVILTRWRFKEAPLKLVYRPRVDLM